MLEQFQERYWTFYRKLLAYRQAPTPEQVPRLEAEFDQLFSTVTGYKGLDERIAVQLAEQTVTLAGGDLALPTAAVYIPGNSPADFNAEASVTVPGGSARRLLGTSACGPKRLG